MENTIKELKLDLRNQVRQLLVQNLSKPISLQGKEVVTRNSHSGSNFKSSLDDRKQIAEYLKSQGFHYALSVFLAEANVPPMDVKEAEKEAEESGREGGEEPQPAHRNLDMKQVAEQLWSRLERKYRFKMKQQARQRKEEMKRRVKIIEDQFSTALTQKEDELNENYLERLEELRRKEEALVAQNDRDRQSHERSVQSRRQELLIQVKELERRRDQLQLLEDEFHRHTKSEEARIRSEREEVSLQELSLKRAQLQINQRLESAEILAREDESKKFGEKLRDKDARIERLEVENTKLRDELMGLQSVKTHSSTRLERIRDLEMQLQNALSALDNERIRSEELSSRLRECSDYDKLRREIQRLKWELQSAQTTDSGSKRAKALEVELRAMKEQRERDQGAMNLREEEWRIKSEAERRRNEELVDLFKRQSVQIRDLNKELERLRLRSEPSTPKLSKKKAVATRFEHSSYSNPSESEVSADSTPDYVKEAKKRMAKLDAESETLNESIRLYEKLSEAKMGQRISFQDPLIFSSKEPLPVYTSAQASQRHLSDLPMPSLPTKSVLPEPRGESPPLIPLQTSPKEPRRSQPIGSSSRITQSEDSAKLPQRQNTKTSSKKTANKTTNQKAEIFSVVRRESEKEDRRERTEKPGKAGVSLISSPQDTSTPIRPSSKEDSDGKASSSKKQTWEERMKEREEERRRADERARLQAEKELRELEDAEQRNTLIQEKSELKEKSGNEPQIDPEMQKYMELVMNQRSKEKSAKAKKVVEQEEKEEEVKEVEDAPVEIAQLSGPSDDDGW